MRLFDLISFLSELLPLFISFNSQKAFEIFVRDDFFKSQTIRKEFLNNAIERVSNIMIFTSKNAILRLIISGLGFFSFVFVVVGGT